MNPLPLVEKAHAYLNVQLTHRGHLEAPDFAGPFVTIGRQAGCGAWALAQTLARELPAPPGRAWSVYSRNLIEEMLRTNDLPPSVARYLPEDRVSEVDASVGELVGLHPNLWTLVRKTTELMRELARGGYVILIGRGANFATAGMTSGVHIRLVAPVADRAAWVAARRNISAAEATVSNAEADAARERYVRANFGVDAAAAAGYDAVINIARVSPPAVRQLVGTLVAAHVPATA